MKKSLLIIAVACTALLFGCKKAETGGEEQQPIKVSLEVTPADDNSAAIKAVLTSGQATGGKIIEDMLVDDVTIDYSKDIQLVKFVEENGKAISFPYENKLTGIKIGKDRFTAVIVYDNTGRAAVTAYKIWTPLGQADGWSSENNPGELEEIEW